MGSVRPQPVRCVGYWFVRDYLFGVFYTLRQTYPAQARLYLKYGTIVGLAASLLVVYPTGDEQAKIVGRHQEVALAAMEGRFHSGPMAEISMIGQPNVKERRLDNPIAIPGILSFLVNGSFHSNVRGLEEFPEDTWPDNIELLYYAFHLMVTMGMIFVALMVLANVQRIRGRLESSRWLLWPLMLAFPFPYIANTLGWMTAELGRQPWLIYGLFRTSEGYSRAVSAGSTVFTFIGFVGLYFILGLLFLYLVGREIYHGPRLRMIEIWYGILSFVLIAYVVLDGRNFGAGILHLIVAKTPAERRQLIVAIGPLWSWDEVWLVAFGGVMFVAFPRLLATAFSGYYLALFLVLWSLILRGISLEVGGHIKDRMWQSFWDFVFPVSNLLLGILFGTALGNVVRGVPLKEDGEFHMAFFTDFGVRGNLGLLDWYTVSVGVACMVMATFHGATYLILKTEGPVHGRCEAVARKLWAILPVLFVLITAESCTCVRSYLEAWSEILLPG